ncbi:MAG: hypothetical protein DMG89_12210 [Acidobacteria bacterium]|nr:MAG: hypothetical protein DMG89_12210 [Acidobacteriota bacterium]
MPEVLCAPCGCSFSVGDSRLPITRPNSIHYTAVTVSGTGTPASPLSFAYSKPTDSSSTVAVVAHYTNKTVQTSFNCSGISEYGPTTVALITDITLPNASKYTFQYELTPGTTNGNVTGRLKSITLPSGGTVTYTYTGGNNGIICADGSAAGLTRVLSPGGTWSYTRSGSGNSWTTTINDPSSPVNQTVINFAKDSSSTATTNFYETQRKVYQGSATGTLLRTTITCYNGNNVTTPLNCPTTSVSSQITRRTKFTYLPDSNGKMAKTDITYNVSGLVTEQDEYDFPSSTVPVRKTTITYASLGNNIVDRPASTVIKDGNNAVKASTTYSYDQTSVTATSGTPQHIAITGSRGNLTTLATKANSTSTLYRKLTYYDTGTLKTSTEPSLSSSIDGATTTYTYGPNISCGNSFVTSLSAPLSLSHSMQWNCNGGVMTSVTDENQKITNFGYGDPNFWRQTSTSYPDGGQTATTYNTATTTPWNITSSAKIDATRNATSKAVLDGFGRITQKQVTSDPNGIAYIDTTYDKVGRIASISNPYYTTTDATYGITSIQYDALNRITTITKPGAATVLIDYTKAGARIQDEGNGTNRVTTIYQNDGLGQLASICEVSSAVQFGISPTPAACGLDISANGFLTSYQYDTLSNLVGVTQGGLNTRTYSYDVLSRMISETNPESGAVSYTYDLGTAADLYQRTAPKPSQTGTATVTTTYSYDAVHRLTGKSYNDGSTPSVAYFYDQTTNWGFTLQNTKGRLTLQSVGTGFAQAIFSYDEMGRIVNKWICTPINCHTSAFALTFDNDLLGNLASLNNGTEGKTYTYTYDTASRLTQMQSTYVDANHPGTLLTVNTYNALGQVKQATLGNGIVRNLQYDNRGRVTSLTDGSIYSFTLGYTSNSNVLTGNDLLNGPWSYTYDDFNRVASSNKGSGQQTFSYKYDRFGNRWQQNAPQGGPAPQYVFDANNHITSSGVIYDAAGNITNDGLGNTYSYDAENRVTTVAGTNSASYVYDANGWRVEQIVNGTTKDFIFDRAGRVITQMSPTWARSELYAGGLHVATYANDATYFDHTDWLGTKRALSNISGSRVETCTSLPFGDAQACTGTDWSPLHFTGQDFDSESNLSHFMFRKLSTTQSRWLTPDPAGMAAGNPGNPQTWNRYAYVVNTPLSKIDFLGLKMIGPGLYLSGGGSGSVCTMDGVDTACSLVDRVLQMGGAVRCPNNNCSPIAINGVQAYFVAYLTGSTYVPYAGPGSIFGTNDQASIAGAMYAENQSLLNNGNEQCGVTYGVGDKYTFSASVQGTATDCTPTNAMTSDYQQIAGAYHSHGEFDPTNRMSEISDFPAGHNSDQGWSNFWGLPFSLATPGWNLIVYYPTPGCQKFFLGGPAGTGTTIPICP